ncbi:MAG TPA: MSMEG_0572/Sll0783 family nitrogen starvation response protein [Chloroflexota bacterium]|nr:MSMEG_0572/Sll0783 family nitrogen starvation response protein [Chloroflexota bacterium]
MAMVEVPRLGEGDEIVNLQEKLFPDYKANPGDKALIMMHTVPFEGSVGLVNMLTATRIRRKGFDTSFVLYGPGVLMAAAGRGFPKVGMEGFPGNLSVNKQLTTIMNEGGKVYACRFAMAALYGMRETDLMEGVRAFSPLDVLDITIENWRAGALILSTWTV